MPELPEVEIIVRDLQDVLVGECIFDVVVLRPDMVRNIPGASIEQLATHTISGVQRNGKYIIFSFTGLSQVCVLHLGMTGHIRILPSTAPLFPHSHIILALEDGNRVVFDDARRFGRILFGTVAALVQGKYMPILGRDPVRDHLTPAWLGSAFQHRKRSVKALLLDQHVIAGLGNIYIDEACFAASIHPARQAGSLSKSEITALSIVIPAILQDAIANRGSSIDDYRDIWNATGKQQEVLRVYGRSGKLCPRCGTLLVKSFVATRGTTTCPRCQGIGT